MNERKARDFNDEANEALSIKDPSFQPSYLQFWTENLPSPTVDTAFAAANAQIAQLNTDARKAAWEKDKLQLAKDCASLAQLCQQEMQSERSRRQQRILHIRAQNTIGASIIENFMERNLAFMHGQSHEILARVEKVGR